MPAAASSVRKRLFVPAPTKNIGIVWAAPNIRIVPVKRISLPPPPPSAPNIPADVTASLAALCVATNPRAAGASAHFKREGLCYGGSDLVDEAHNPCFTGLSASQAGEQGDDVENFSYWFSPQSVALHRRADRLADFSI